jgi:hypothetical protein
MNVGKQIFVSKAKDEELGNIVTERDIKYWRTSVEKDVE